MITNALGFIETIGLTAAIEAADTAVKAANVHLIGYELAKGDGMTAVKIEGDVGAVKAAVTAAQVAAAKVGKVVSVHVIPRPARDTEYVVLTPETVGLEKAAKKAPPKPEPVHHEPPAPVAPTSVEVSSLPPQTSTISVATPAEPPVETPSQPELALAPVPEVKPKAPPAASKPKSRAGRPPKKGKK
jgi:microcompartment protein CcmL/EutN